MAKQRKRGPNEKGPDDALKRIEPQDLKSGDRPMQRVRKAIDQLPPTSMQNMAFGAIADLSLMGRVESIADSDGTVGRVMSAEGKDVKVTYSRMLPKPQTVDPQTVPDEDRPLVEEVAKQSKAAIDAVKGTIEGSVPEDAMKAAFEDGPHSEMIRIAKLTDAGAESAAIRIERHVDSKGSENVWMTMDWRDPDQLDAAVKDLSGADRGSISSRAEEAVSNKSKDTGGLTAAERQISVNLTPGCADPQTADKQLRELVKRLTKSFGGKGA